MSVLVVGAGFSGATVARCLHDAGAEVVVIDRRPYLGGTAHDYVDEHGIRVSSHGAHIFHTNAMHVVEFLSRFTEWTAFEHRVLALPDGLDQLVPMPINRTTVNALFDLDLETADDVEQFLAQEAESRGYESNAEVQVTSKVGRRLFELLYERYTLKQWGRPASELSSYVTGRLPVRYDDDDRYFSDRFQAQPKISWAELFERMLEGITVGVGVEYSPDMAAGYDHVVHTGPIDEFFSYALGPLPWRSVHFEHRNLPGPELALPAGVVNYCGDEPYTRKIEWRQLTGQSADSTTVTTEFPSAEGEPHYPVPCRESWDLHRRYRELAADLPDVTFIGRLGAYRYMTMDQTVAQALKAARLIATTTSLPVS